MKPITPEFFCPGNAAQVARAAADRILSRAQRAIAERGRFRLVVAGGTTPLSTYRLLSAARADWLAWEIFFGDERCLPADHPERNSRAVAEAWLDRLPEGVGAAHRIAADQGPEPAAAAYAGLVAGVMPFDLVLLGIGEDGHTASLFPDTLYPPDRLVVPVRNAPKPPRERVSMTPAAFSGAGEILILVTGASKHAAVTAWRNGADLPVARAAAAGRSLVLIDEAASGQDDCRPLGR